MNKAFDDDARFDRLVDGELSAGEYRALIASLDDEPAGWRRCALAFLESQALAGEISGVRCGMTLGDDGADAPVNPAPTAGLAKTSRPRSFRLTTLLAMAASFLVAFGLGIALPRWLPPRGQQPVVAGAAGVSPAVTSVATNSNQPRHESFKPIGNVHFVVDGPGGDSTSVGNVPIFEGPGSVDQWLANERPALSPELLQTLQQRGHQVERQIEYVTMQLDDGRQVIVPVERYQIRPANRLPY